MMNRSLAYLLVGGWLVLASAVCPVIAGEPSCEALRSYGAYALCCVERGQPPVSAAAWVRGRRTPSTPKAAPPSDESPGNPLARGPYRAERARHDALRARADLLSQHPRMQRYQARADELKRDDDRKVAQFDRQAAPSGGSAAALPGLKRHDDKLQKMVHQVEGVVGR
jgi:hypothetical protein